jgi:flagellar protein FliO/FliZ
MQKIKLVLSTLLFFFSYSAVAQVATPEVGGVRMVLQVFGTLIGIIALIFAVAWVMKRLQLVNPSFGRQVKILESLHLGRKEKLVLIEVGAKKILLGVSSQSINVIHQLDQATEKECEQPVKNDQKKVDFVVEGVDENKESFSDFLKSILVKEQRK